jgi:ribonuclease H / adenosylcobalamin/alpha-ribazole phosphatase
VTGRRLVVEADGAARGNPGPASYGAVVRDAATGAVLAERAQTLGSTTNNVAEYSGLIAALEAAFDLDPSAEVEVRMDSKLVIEQMAGRWAVKHPNLKPLARRARALIPAYERVRWTWIPRAQNGHADRLANAALDGKPIGAEIGRSIPAQPEVQELPKAAAGPQPKIIGWAGDLGTTTTMLLLRHGETDHTAQRRFSGGASDPGLSEIGRRQADLTADHLAARGGIDVVVSSPLRRARETAGAAGDALGVEVVIDDDLRECDFGSWDGLAFGDVASQWGPELAAWLAAPALAPPGGESLEQVAARVGEAQARMLARHSGRSLLVVAHVTPIKLLIRSALDAAMGLVHRLQLSPASLSVVCWYGDGNSAMHSFNDTAHLGSHHRGDGA